MTGSGETETRLRALARKLEALSAVGAPTSERARVRSEHARVMNAIDSEQALENALLALSEARSIGSDEPEETRARTIAACEATVAICYQAAGGDDAAALEHALAGLEALGDLEDDLARFRLHNAQAVVYLNFGQADRALASFAQARESAAHLQDATPLSVLNTNIACVYLEILDQPDRAIPHLDRALALEEAEPIARVWALQALGRAQNKLGEHELALHSARKAEDIAERHGLQGSVSTSLLVAGDALRALERGDEALTALTRSVEVARRARTGYMIAEALTALGECEAALGRTDAARAALEEASELTADRNPVRHPLSALASLAATTGDHVSAYAYLMRYHEIVQRSADAQSRMASSVLEVEHQVASVRQEAELARREQQLLREHTDVLEQRVRERTEELETEVKLRAEAETRLHQAQKMEAVGQLTGGIAHDFNNILQVIVGNLEITRVLLKRQDGHDSKGTEPLLKAIETAQKASRSAAQLVQRLLAFGRQQRLEPTPLDANTLISDMADMISRTLAETVEVETALAPELWTTFADRNQLESALLNLVVNARDAMPDGGRLMIETANIEIGDTLEKDIAPGHYVMVSVSDTGCGIAKELLDKVFEPFFTTKDVGMGSGLGLSMVYGFVKQSRGHVRIYSEMGSGTTVKIYLPRLLSGDAMQRIRASGSAFDEAMARAMPGETLLLVEDNGDVRQWSSAALQSLGYHVLEAEDAPSALRVLDGAGGSRIDLLFTDLVLPGGMSGSALAEQMLARRAGLPVLFTSGYTRNAIAQQGRLAPDVRILAKPYTLETLASQVRQAIDSARQNAIATPR